MQYDSSQAVPAGSFHGLEMLARYSGSPICMCEGVLRIFGRVHRIFGGVARIFGGVHKMFRGVPKILEEYPRYLEGYKGYLEE